MKEDSDESGEEEETVAAEPAATPADAETDLFDEDLGELE